MIKLIYLLSGGISICEKVWRPVEGVERKSTMETHICM